MHKSFDILSCLYPKQDLSGIFLSGNQGYWSNLSPQTNDLLLKAISLGGIHQAVKQVIPDYYDMIFSSKREAALELLDHSSPKVCIDYGCMWGVLTEGMAKRGHDVIAIDQTYDSLKFLSLRLQENNLNAQVSLVQDDLKLIRFENIADYALVNGVLEWIPTSEDVYVADFYKRGSTLTQIHADPIKMQSNFLKRVANSLKHDGKLLLAIENKHFYQYYLGRKDPHSNLLFTTFLPRRISDLISRLLHKKNYRTIIHSFEELQNLVLSSGFARCEMYMCFPDYHFPELILPFSAKGVSLYKYYPNQNRVTFKQKFAYLIEIILFKYLKLRGLAPSIIVVASK